MSDDREILRTLAKALGLSGQVNADGTRVKVTGSMVVAKVVAMRDELAALKTQANSRKREREADDGDASEDLEVGAVVPAPQRKKGMSPSFADCNRIHPSKMNQIDELPPVPAEFQLRKFVRFVGDTGLTMVILGRNSHAVTQHVLCGVEADLYDDSKPYINVRKYCYEPSWIAKQLGIDLSHLQTGKLEAKFWRWIGGEPRDLMALVFKNTWLRVEVVEWHVRKRKCPVLVKIKEGEHIGKRYYLPKHQDCFREVAP